jgi:hypothetical protein
MKNQNDSGFDPSQEKLKKSFFKEKMPVAVATGASSLVPWAV